MTDRQFPGSTDAQRSMQEHILNFIRLPMENCICGCHGYPANLLPADSIDYADYRTCPARLKRTAMPAYRKFRESPEYLRAMPSANTRRVVRRIEREKASLRKKQSEECAAKVKMTQAELEKTAEQERHQNGLPALSQGEAQRRGLKTYQGNPCASAHDGERLARNGECIACRTADKTVREAMKRGAYPEYLTQQERDEIVAIYANCRRITETTGIEHHVDHVIPLAAGGRHHPSNLEIITAKANLEKGALHKGVRHRRPDAIWGDVDALEVTDVTAANSREIEEAEPRGVWGWLRRVFS